MAIPVNIDDLVNAKTVEGVRIEFKKGWNPHNVLRTMCAFANDIDGFNGGYIITGIEEENGSPLLPPSGLEKKDLDKIQKEFFKLCQDNIEPKIFPVIDTIEFQNKWIIVIWVTNGEGRPYRASNSLGKNAQKVPYVRHGSVTKEATKEQENQLIELAQHKYFDDRVNEKASIKDLDFGLMLSYLQETKSQLYDEATKITVEELCTKMQIARGPKENFRPLNVGLLLFSREPEKYFPGCLTNLVEFEDESGTKYSEKKFNGPVHIQIRQIMQYLETAVIKQFVRKDSHKAESTRFFNFPYQALEEAVVNALYHRSYENPTPNEIRIYKVGVDRRIEILSYPGPMPPIDEQALLQLKIIARNYRNIRLGDWLKNLRLAEKFATGIPTIVDALKTNGSPKPILSTDALKSHFLTVFKIHPDTPIELSASIEEIELVKLTEPQQTILEKLVQAPQLEEVLLKQFDFDITLDIKYFIEKDLVGVMEVNSAKVLFIKSKGTDVLKSSF